MTKEIKKFLRKQDKVSRKFDQLQEKALRMLEQQKAQMAKITAKA